MVHLSRIRRCNQPLILVIRCLLRDSQHVRLWRTINTSVQDACRPATGILSWLSGSAFTHLYADQLCTAIARLVASNSAVKVVCGMDESDPARPLVTENLGQHACDAVTLHTFSNAELKGAADRSLTALGKGCTAVRATGEKAVPICWMWGELARRAVSFYGADLLLLLGDDIEIQPQAWAEMILGQSSLDNKAPCFSSVAQPSLSAVAAQHTLLGAACDTT